MQKYTWFYSLRSKPDSITLGNLKRDFDAFLQQWHSHGNTIHGSIQILHDQFIVVRSSPSESRPSGCSIDSMKRAVNVILQNAGLECFDAGHVFYRTGSGEIRNIHFSEIGPAVQAGKLNSDTLVLDHSLGQSDDFSRWEAPLKDTWLARFLPKDTLAGA